MLIHARAGQADMAGIMAEMGRVIEVVRTFIPSEKWPEVQAALRGDAPIRQQQSKPVKRASAWSTLTTPPIRTATDGQLPAPAGSLHNIGGRGRVLTSARPTPTATQADQIADAGHCDSVGRSKTGLLLYRMPIHVVSTTL